MATRAAARNMLQPELVAECGLLGSPSDLSPPRAAANGQARGGARGGCARLPRLLSPGAPAAGLGSCPPPPPALCPSARPGVRNWRISGTQRVFVECLNVC